MLTGVGDKVPEGGGGLLLVPGAVADVFIPTAAFQFTPIAFDAGFHYPVDGRGVFFVFPCRENQACSQAPQVKLVIGQNTFIEIVQIINQPSAGFVETAEVFAVKVPADPDP